MNSNEPYEWIRCGNPKCGKWHLLLRSQDATQVFKKCIKNGELYNEPYEWIRCGKPKCGKWHMLLRSMEATHQVDRCKNGENEANDACDGGINASVEEDSDAFDGMEEDDEHLGGAGGGVIVDQAASSRVPSSNNQPVKTKPKKKNKAGGICLYVGGIQTEVKELRKKYEETNDRLNGYAEGMEDVLKKCQDMKGVVSHHEAEIRRLAKENGELELELQKTSDGVEGMKDVVSHHEAEIRHLTKENGELEIELQKTQKTCLKVKILNTTGHRYFPFVHFTTGHPVYARKAQDTTAMTTPDEEGYLPLHRALIQGDASLGSIKLLVKENVSALQVGDSKGVRPIHIACQNATIGIIEFLTDTYDGLDISDSNKDYPLHYACRTANLDVVKYLIGKSNSGVSNVNNNNKLPFHLLVENEDEQVRDSPEFTGACFLLLRAHPETVMMETTKKRKRNK